MSGTHLLETDLRAVRELRDISLEHVQQVTRIPLDVLKRFEDGHLVGDPTYNDVYLKAFLRSYAKAVSVPQSEAVSAFDAQRSGQYNGQLHPEYVAPPKAEKASADIESEHDAVESLESLAASLPTPEPPPPVQAMSSAAPIIPPPPPSQPISSKRVSPPMAAGSRRSFDKNWGTILGLFSVVVVLLGLAVWALVFRTNGSSDEESRAEIVAGADTTATEAATAAPRLELPLELTVTAAGNGLQSFRVSADGGERSPYWIEQGESQSFTADSSIVFWGEGSGNEPGLIFEEAVLSLQGTSWTPQNGAPVVIDAVSGQRLLDSLSALPQTRVPAPATQ